MKRLGILILIVLFAVALLSACGQKEGETQATKQETQSKQAEMMDTTRMDSAAMDTAGMMDTTNMTDTTHGM
jgi:uncharacterized membrane protein affecting hemolysin expression